MGHEHDGGSGMMDGMMQRCMEMMGSMMGGSTEHANGATSSMGFDLPLSLIAVLVLAGALGYLLGVRRSRAQA